MVLIDERTCLGFVLSYCPSGVMEGEQFISLHGVPFQVAYLWGSVHDCNRDAATSVGSVN
jgi:hypothetical protein